MAAAVTLEIGTRLDRVDESLQKQHDMQVELLQYVKALTQSMAHLSDQIQPKKENHPEFKVRSMRSNVVSVQSLVQLESQMLEVVASHPLGALMASDGGDEYGPIPSNSLVSLVPSPGIPGIPGPPEQEAAEPAPDPKLCESLPGGLQDETWTTQLDRGEPEEPGEPSEALAPKGKNPKTSTCLTARLCQMNEESQTNILGSASVGSIEAPYDMGSRIILAMPSVIYMALGISILCQVALAVTCGSLQCPSDAGIRSLVLESITYGIAAVLCIRCMKQALVSSSLNLAVGRLYTFVAEFQVDWSQVSGKEGRKYIAVWLLMLLVLIGARCLGSSSRVNSSSFALDLTHEVLLNTMEILALVIYGVSSAMVTAAAYALSHLLLGLDKSLDCWCSRIMALPDFREGVRSWNVLQALLKSVGRELAGTFVILQIFGSLCFIIFLVNGVVLVFSDLEAVPWIVEVLSGVTLLFMSCLCLKVSAHGAAITEKCRAIPPFVNQIPTDLIDHERQYLVRFVTDSSAGFCVRNVKLTQEMVMKQIYLVGALLSATVSALSRALI